MITDLISARELLELERSEEHLKTGLPSLDAIFGGGIVPGTFLEIVGPSSSGKTQLCMQLAMNLQKNQGKCQCMYLDTEGGFHTGRLCQIAGKKSSDQCTSFLDHISVCRCNDMVELMSTMHRLQSLVANNSKIGLIIVDSVAMPFRGETDYLRRCRLDVARILSELTATHRKIVVVVNHVAYRFQNDEEAYLSSALGNAWAHRPNTRLWLSSLDTDSRFGTICVKKSPAVANGVVCFKFEFLAVLADQGAADNISKIVEFFSKICKQKLALRITSDAVFMINGGDLLQSGTYLRVRLTVNEFFSKFVMGGISEELNEIVMEVNKEHLFRALNEKDASTKICLTKIGNVPHLRIEQKTCGLKHDIPTQIIPSRHFEAYDHSIPDGVQVALHLPSCLTLRTFISAYKNMGFRYMALKGSQIGELRLCGDSDSANIVAYLTDLKALPIAEGMIPEKLAVFSAEQNEASVYFVVGGLA